jgi:outer membrane protein insertion porin family
MIKFFLTIFITLMSSFSIKAEIVNNIIIDGNIRVSDETVKLYGKIKLSKDYREKDLDLILKNLYNTNFFEDIKISLKNNTLSISLIEYPLINQLVIVGEKSNGIKKQIRELINSKEKRPYVNSFIAKDVDIIKTLYSSIGYNSSKVEAKVKKNDDSNYDLLIQINRGEKTKIKSIDFIGNDSIRSKRLREVVASEENKFWKVISRNTSLSKNLINLDTRLLTNYYKSLGFYDVKITSNLAKINQSGNAELIYSIDEGKRFTINKISTNVDQVFDKKLFFSLNQAYKKYIGEYYSPFKIKKLLEEMDDLIDNNNLQFVEHNVQETIEGDSINIVFNVFEGKKVLIERINITGNTVTNEDVIRSEMIIDEGDPFTQLNLDKSIAEIKSRNLFRNVKYEVLSGSKENLKIVNLEVEEKPTGEISAGAGIGTNGGSFAINIVENNWLGQGKSIGFNIEVDQESLGGTISYNDPNYNFLGNSISYSLASEENDRADQGYENSIITGSVGTSFEQYKDVDAILGLSASYDDLRTSDTASTSLKKQSGSFNELAGNYGFTIDKRNRSFQPTSGSIVSFGQTLPIYADKSFISNTLSSSIYKTFSENIIGSTKFYLTTISGLGSDDVRLSKRGGLSSKRLRGFEKNKVGPKDGTDHIGGNYVAALNFETYLPNFLPEDTNTDISLFLDFGNVWGVDYDSTIDKSNKIRSSTGVSASWTSPLGPMTFTFAQNLSKADTDITETFNFNLGTTF